MVKDTSREAYAKLDTPTLDERVYRALHDNAEISTRRELARYMGEEASTVAGSINRLIKSGAVTVRGKITCLVTGRNVESIWPTSELT